MNFELLEEKYGGILNNIKIGDKIIITNFIEESTEPISYVITSINGFILNLTDNRQLRLLRKRLYYNENNNIIPSFTQIDKAALSGTNLYDNWRVFKLSDLYLEQGDNN